MNEWTQAYIPVGTLERFPARIGVRVRVNGLEAAVFRLSDGRIFALENKNPHRKGGVLSEGMVSGEYLYDPLYDWKIHLPTGLVQEPDTGAVRTLEVKIENGTVFLAG
ncbi:nitrite reductase small subunit NirD [Gorillibacterium sp. sgz5001074]|uniref:nitrite reductase small subunit NirD n=1 Tax=Gorillibacterium sp. sgz5001074 TaxID=3446695 RepID=UPI003F671447